MVRTSVTLLSGCALAVLLGSGPEGALASGSKEQLCEANKMEAASRYYNCLTNAMRKTLVKGGAPSDEEIARCDRQFDRAFERADEHADCHTPGGALPIRDAIKEQVQATYTTVLAATGPCAALYFDQGRAICALSQSQSFVDLTEMLEQINSDPGVTTTVDTGTTIFIEAWAGPGGNGSAGGGSSDEGQGRPGGYAQMTTTVADIQTNYGVTELYYYLGKKGGPSPCVSGAKVCGGNGGTATLVMSKDATANRLTEASLLLLAGAGGGGGSANTELGPTGCKNETGLNGGAGATAISGLGAEKRVSGDDGDQKSSGVSGQGGGSGGNGGTGPTDHVGNGSAQAGDNEFAPIGGIGGRNTSTSVGFINVPAILAKGHGGAGGTPDSIEADAPGGAGGGGLAGGGGGTEAYNESDCDSGGGGGGSSLAKASTRSCKIAPTTKPPNPGGSTGYVRIGIDLGGC